MYLMGEVMDKQLVDRNGHKAGKVSDLVLELRPDGPPAVRAIATGHGALFPILPGPIARVAGWIERHVLGLTQVEPQRVGWEHVTRIDVAVHIDLDRVEAGLVDTEHAIWQRWLKPLPFSQR